MTSIKLDEQTNNYRRYFLYLDNRCIGKVVVEKYNDIWNLELLQVIIFTRRGYARQLIDHVFKDLNINSMTVCPVTEASKALFTKYYKYNASLGKIYKY